MSAPSPSGEVLTSWRTQYPVRGSGSLSRCRFTSSMKILVKRSPRLWVPSAFNSHPNTFDSCFSWVPWCITSNTLNPASTDPITAGRRSVTRSRDTPHLRALATIHEATGAPGPRAARAGCRVPQPSSLISTSQRLVGERVCPAAGQAPCSSTVPGSNRASASPTRPACPQPAEPSTRTMLTAQPSRDDRRPGPARLNGCRWHPARGAGRARRGHSPSGWSHRAGVVLTDLCGDRAAGAHTGQRQAGVDDLVQIDLGQAPDRRTHAVVPSVCRSTMSSTVHPVSASHSAPTLHDSGATPGSACPHVREHPRQGAVGSGSVDAVDTP